MLLVQAGNSLTDVLRVISVSIVSPVCLQPG